mgnify:CR=1 FL=1
MFNLRRMVDLRVRCKQVELRNLHQNVPNFFRLQLPVDLCLLTKKKKLSVYKFFFPPPTFFFRWGGGRRREGRGCTKPNKFEFNFAKKKKIYLLRLHLLVTLFFFFTSFRIPSCKNILNHFFFL